MTTTTTQPLREAMFADLYATYGQGDTHRTNAIITTTLGHVHAEVAPRLVRDFAEWLVAFGEIPAGQRQTTMNEIITRARQALLLPEYYEVPAGGSRFGQIEDPCGPEVHEAYDRTHTRPLADLAATIVALDDPAPSTLGAMARRTTGLDDLIAHARRALARTAALADGTL